MISSMLNAMALPFGKRAMDALTMLIKGMAMVFSVLIVLMVALIIMEKIFNAKNKKAAQKSAAEPAPAVVAEPAKTEENDDGAVVAAITAAIAMTLAAENNSEYTGGFRVVSFKRVGGKSAWNVRN